MKILHGNGFNQEERRAFRLIILQNIVDSIQALVLAMRIFEIPYVDTENKVSPKENSHGSEITK